MRAATADAPEILAPAGDETTLATALAAGANAVYFGLKEGFHARLRAESFALEELAEVVRRIHRAGARAYLTLNTLVHQGELARFEGILRQVALAGVDAVILQDLGAVRLARALCPELPVHASTQMTISSGRSAAFAEALGVCRINLARELSLRHIRTIAAQSRLELEVFAHGALCVSWSGQCQASATWSDRSANRGECAQPCRMPYELVVDGVSRGATDAPYLLSPKDLCTLDLVPELIRSGVRGLKIEGRLKGPAYVLAATRALRQRIAAALQASQSNTPPAPEDGAAEALLLSYSRGFTSGFLGETPHGALLADDCPRHRGVYVGRVRSVRGREVVVEAEPRAPELRPGMGLVFAATRDQAREQGGPLFTVSRSGTRLRLGFGSPGPDLKQIHPGDGTWLTRDPRHDQAARQLLRAAPEGRIGLRLSVAGREGQPLLVGAHGDHPAAGAVALQLTVESAVPLARARGAGLNERLLRQKLGAFGGTPFTLEALGLDALPPGLHLPVSELKNLRRALVARLSEQLDARPARMVSQASMLGLAGSQVVPAALGRQRTLPEIVALCRTPDQLEGAIDGGAREVELELAPTQVIPALQRARAAGLRVVLATLQVQQPGEEWYDEWIARLQPDGVLIRHLGALGYFSGLPANERPTLHGDSPLNVTNALSASYLRGLGLSTISPARDLQAGPLRELLRAAPSGFAVAVRARGALFHTKFCLFSAKLGSTLAVSPSRGRDQMAQDKAREEFCAAVLVVRRAQNSPSNAALRHLGLPQQERALKSSLGSGAARPRCGRPCDDHGIALRDAHGHDLPIAVDACCRNSIYGAKPAPAPLDPAELVAAGVERLRLELLDEGRDETAALLRRWAARRGADGS